MKRSCNSCPLSPPRESIISIDGVVDSVPPAPKKQKSPALSEGDTLWLSSSWSSCDFSIPDLTNEYGFDSSVDSEEKKWRLQPRSRTYSAESSFAPSHLTGIFRPVAHDDEDITDELSKGLLKLARR